MSLLRAVLFNKPVEPVTRFTRNRAWAQLKKSFTPVQAAAIDALFAFTDKFEKSSVTFGNGGANDVAFAAVFAALEGAKGKGFKQKLKQVYQANKDAFKYDVLLPQLKQFLTDRKISDLRFAKAQLKDTLKGKKLQTSEAFLELVEKLTSDA